MEITKILILTIAGLNLAFLSVIPASNEAGKLLNTGTDLNDCLVPKGQKTNWGLKKKERTERSGSSETNEIVTGIFPCFGLNKEQN